MDYLLFPDEDTVLAKLVGKYTSSNLTTQYLPPMPLGNTERSRCICAKPSMP